jgi:hypothetical protein
MTIANAGPPRFDGRESGQRSLWAGDGRGRRDTLASAMIVGYPCVALWFDSQVL